MRQPYPLALADAGTLIRPGPIGRIVRLGFGALCFFVLRELFDNWALTMDQPFSTLDDRILVLLAPLCVANYVVNIGFARSWGYRPLVASLIALTGAACSALLVSGGLDSPMLGLPLNLWLAYFYGDLGVSFVLSAMIATPGCEMRSIPDLFGRIRGKPADEHHCPAAFITKIDSWEQRRRMTS